jgi:hypothetical protein
MRLAFAIPAVGLLIASLLVGMHAGDFDIRSSRHAELATMARALALGAAGVAMTGAAIVGAHRRDRPGRER